MKRRGKSYLLILYAIIFACLLPLPASAVTQTSNIEVSGDVPEPPPNTAPTIEKPAPGDTFTAKSITVEGSCISGLIVKIFRNNIFAGSALCQENGTYSLTIDLFIGQNDLVARQYNSSGQSSPPSNTVTVFYAPPSQPSPSLPVPGPSPEAPEEQPSTADFQLFINYDYTVLSAFAKKPFQLPIQFSGGTGPYAVSINWGDGSSDVFSRNNTELFTAEHTYESAGYYIVTIKVSDSRGQQASLQFVLLVQGEQLPSSFLTQPFDTDYGWWAIAVPIGILILLAGFAIGARFGRRH